MNGGEEARAGERSGAEPGDTGRGGALKDTGEEARLA